MKAAGSSCQIGENGEEWVGKFRLRSTARDESDFVGWLAGKWDMLCVPRTIEDVSVGPVPLGHCKASEQLFFPETVLNLVQQSIVPIWGHPVQHHIDPRVADGSCVEWLRTREAPGHVFVVGGAAGGRFYFCDDKTKASSPMLNKVVNAIFRHVNIHYPLISTGPFHRYIAPHLSALLLAGTATIVYPSGQAVEFTENPKCKAPNNGKR